MGKSIGMRIFAAALLAVPLLAHAVGLGNLRVLSALGQPLNAEIQIVSEHPGEMDSVTARLASQDAFHAAGIDFNPVLLGMQFKLEHRDGKAVLKVTTRQPVNDPFLDMLVELQWSSGRLVREYTFLLDPPTYKKMPKETAVLPSAAPMEKPAPAPAAAAPTPAPAAAPIVEKPLEAASPPEAGPPPPPFLPQPKNPVTYKVKKGDTLGEIARDNLPSGVTYNQMLIALYRANKEAFIRDNINLVRAGRILDIPDHEAVAAIDPDTATRLVRSQIADFAAYRRKLAAAAASAAAASAGAGEQAVSGSISTTQEKAAPAEQKDQLRLSKAEAGNPSGEMSRAASGDDRAAQARALQEAQSRVAELEKNVNDLQKLVELKNKQLAELQQKAAATPAAQAPVAPAAPKPAAAPSAPQPTAQAPAQTHAPAAQPPKPATAPAPTKPAPKPKPRTPPPPPPPSFLDELLDNTAALGGLGAVLVLLLGYGAWKWQRKKKSGRAGPGGGSFGASVGRSGEASVLGAGAAPSIGNISQASVSQSSVGGMEADEVDPIAEADVYMAYGRDAQAEEILKEALQKDAKRPAIHAKLLEIYAARRDTRSFEDTARKLQALTGGSSPEWEKAAALGRSIDVQNPMYGGSTGAPTVAEVAHEPAPAPNLDFDLDAASAPVAPDIPLDIGSETSKQPGSDALDFELGATTTSMQASDFAKGGTLILDKNAEQPEPAPEPGTEGLDFDLGMGGAESPRPAETTTADFEPPATQAATAPAEAEPAGGMDFNFSLDMGEDKTMPEPEPAAPSAPLDLSSISLDLDTPEQASAASASADPKWQEVATKLDLAKAYEEMGDKDGARELLNEVVKEGDSTQQSQAQQMLSSLG